MYASFTSTSTSSVARSAIVTTAPRVSPPPTDGATTSPTSASFRSTVPVNGARMYVFSSVGLARSGAPRRPHAIRASAAPARAAAWVGAAPRDLRTPAPRPAPGCSPRISLTRRGLARELVALGARLGQLGAGARQVGLAPRPTAACVVGVLQPRDDLAPADVGSLAHPQRRRCGPASWRRRRRGCARRRTRWRSRKRYPRGRTRLPRVPRPAPPPSPALGRRCRGRTRGRPPRRPALSRAPA